MNDQVEETDDERKARLALEAQTPVVAVLGDKGKPTRKVKTTLKAYKSFYQAQGYVLEGDKK